jgi:hypothetical protein
MAFVEITRRLWQHKLLVTGVFVVAIAVAIFSAYRVTSSGLEKRALSVAAASGQILVDNAERPNSTKGIEAGEFEALETRAKIYAQYLAGYDAKLRIAKEANIPPASLATTGPFSGGPSGEIYASQGSEERTAELLKEGTGNRANFTAQEDVPIITVQTQAETTGTAVAIAAASYDVLKAYIHSFPHGNGPVTDSVVIRQLGTPDGGEVGGNNNVMLMALAFIVVFGLGCAAILFAPTFIQRWRALSEAERAEDHDEEDLVGTGPRADDLVIPPYPAITESAAPRRRRGAKIKAEFRDDETGKAKKVEPVTVHGASTR